MSLFRINLNREEEEEEEEEGGNKKKKKGVHVEDKSSLSLFSLHCERRAKSCTPFFFFVCVCMGIEADDEKKKKKRGGLRHMLKKKKKKLKHQEKSDAWRSSSKCKQRDPLLFFFFFFFLILHLPPFFSGFPCSSSVLVDLLELPMPDLFFFFFPCPTLRACL